MRDTEPDSPGRRPAPARRERRHRAAPFWAVAILLFAAAAAEAADSTLKGSPTGVYQPYFENNVLKALMYQGGAHPVFGDKNRILIENGFWIKTFRDGDTNRLESFTRGPDCILTTKPLSLSSDDRITIFSLATNSLGVLATNLVISGVGFSSARSNTVFEIWSEARTAVSTGSNAPPVLPPPFLGPPAPEEVVVIHSEFLQFSQITRLANFRGRVRADQFPYTLECPVMDVQLSSNNAPASIFADGGVLITDARDQGRATGARAVYEAGGGFFHLTGEPHWTDTLGRQVWAREFVLDRNTGILHANGEARALLPGKTIGLGNLGLPGDTARTNNAGDSIFDIRADALDFEVGGAQTNRPGAGPSSRRFAAHRNVVMTNEAENAWAVCDEAAFSEATGILQLKGRARWLRGLDQVEGDVIEANRAERTMRSRSHSVVRVPSRAPSPGAAKSVLPPRGFIEVRSEDFLWQTNVATFTGGGEKVHAIETEEGERAGRMDCFFLALTFDETNRIRQLRGRGGVNAEQFATKARNSTLRATCEVLNVWWYPGGNLLQRIEAEQLTGLDQKVEDRLGRRETARSARAGTLWMNFSGTTNNQVESASSENHVFLRQREVDRDAKGAVLKRGERGALGERADYAAEPPGRGLLLTGAPLGWLESTNLTDKKFTAEIITNATSLGWSAVTKQARGAGRYEIHPIRPGQEPR